jgi:hypothetical protein
MSQQMSRRSALKVASGASFLFLSALYVAGCSNDKEIDPTIKTETGKTAEESIKGQAGKGGKKAEPSTTQRVKGGPG